MCRLYDKQRHNKQIITLHTDVVAERSWQQLWRGKEALAAIAEQKFC